MLTPGPGPSHADAENSTEAVLREQELDDPGETPDAEPTSLDDAFFGFRPLEEEARPQDVETAEEELERYMVRVMRVDTVQACYGRGASGKREYPRLAYLFLKLNTALPASPNVERLFSGGSLSFSDLRNRLGDATLEMEVLLSANKVHW